MAINMRGIEPNQVSRLTQGLGESPRSSQEVGGFKNALTKGIESVNKDMTNASKMSEEFMTGNKHSLHEVLISLEKADLSFRYLSQIRNKVLDAYHEVMRMQV